MFHEEWKLPLWVKYELTASETDGDAVRDGKNFKQGRERQYAKMCHKHRYA